MLCGTTPYDNKITTNLYTEISRKPVKFPETRNLSANCRDFIVKLLGKNPKYRLGATGVKEVLNHPWLATVDTDQVLNKEVVPPYKPKRIKDIFDTSAFNPQNQQ